MLFTFKQNRATMIDPTLEGDPANNPTDGAGPSILDVAGISNKTERHNKEAEQLQNEFELHAKSIRKLSPTNWHQRP
jgi:hypothetical protein